MVNISYFVAGPTAQQMQLKIIKFGSTFINSLIRFCDVSTLECWYHVETDCFPNMTQIHGVTISRIEVCTGGLFVHYFAIGSNHLLTNLFQFIFQRTSLPLSKLMIYPPPQWWHYLKIETSLRKCFIDNTPLITKGIAYYWKVNLIPY